MDDWVTGEVTINIQGRPLDLKMTVPAKPTKIRKMLPIFRQMANSFVQLSSDSVATEGKTISCKAGCGACCRQPVPVSEPEAFAIAALVEEMPEPRRTEIRERFEKACRHFTETGWFEKLDSASFIKPENRSEIGLEYFIEGIPCPFLEDESCSIHEHRPIACREYLVTSPAENCNAPGPDNIDMVPLLVKPSVTLCSMTKSGDENPAVSFVPLILSLIWAETREEDQTEKTGEEWMAAFFQRLTNSSIPEAGNKA